MPGSIFGVCKLCCHFPGDLTSLSEISNTPLGPPEIVLGYVYITFHFCFQDLPMFIDLGFVSQHCISAEGDPISPQTGVLLFQGHALMPAWLL